MPLVDLTPCRASAALVLALFLGACSDGAGPGSDDLIAQRLQGVFGQGPAHRSIVPVRRIFFCSCSTP